MSTSHPRRISPASQRTVAQHLPMDRAIIPPRPFSCPHPTSSRSPPHAATTQHSSLCVVPLDSQEASRQGQGKEGAARASVENFGFNNIADRVHVCRWTSSSRPSLSPLSTTHYYYISRSDWLYSTDFRNSFPCCFATSVRRSGNEMGRHQG